MSGTQTPAPPYSPHAPSYYSYTRPTTEPANPATEETPLVASTVDDKSDSTRWRVWVTVVAYIVIICTWISASQDVDSAHAEWEKLELHRALVEDEVEAFKQQEHEIQRRIRDLEAKEKAQDESRKMLTIFWDVEPVKRENYCAAYGVQYYFSRLHGVPPEFDGARACSKKAHPELGFPTWCGKDEWGVHGHWRVTDDPGCKISWQIDSLKNEGCTAAGSGKRRYEQHMERLLHHSADDWFSICTTAPTDFHGLHFDKPDYCSDRGHGEMFGVWEVEDRECLD